MEEKDRKIFITIGREFGSGGHKIGQMLADLLGIAYYDNELILLAARKGEMLAEKLERYDEKKTNPFLYEINYGGNENVTKGKSMEETLFELQSAVILELAEQKSAVFVGRCADYVLKKAGYRNVLSVFISAPLDYRIARTKAIEELDEKTVRTMTKKKDARRRKYYELHTGKKWGAPESYDLFFDSSDFGSLYEVAESLYQKLLPVKQR